MRRESWRHVVVFALVSAACTNGAADGTTTTEQATASSAIESTTTIAPPTTTTTSTTGETTTTTEFTDTVGSPEALARLVNEANAISSLAYGAEVAAAPIPNLTAADPLEAVRALYRLEADIVQTAPVDEWFDVLVYPESPVSFEYLSDLQTLSANQLVAVVRGDGYIIHDTQLASPSHLERLPRDIQADLPNGSAVVVVTSSSGPIDYVDPDGEVAISSSGWSNRSRLIVVAPTDSGWKLYWTEDV